MKRIALVGIMMASLVLSVLPIPATLSAQVANGCPPGAKFNIYTGQPCATNPKSVPTPASQSASCLNLPVNIAPGTRSALMPQVQNFLKAKGFFKGITTSENFGPLSVAAVKAFQIANGLPPVGNLGPFTRAALLAQSCATGSAVVATACDLPIVGLKLGFVSHEVTKLQTFLRSQGDFTYPSFTRNFGPVTDAALRKYQEKKGLAITGLLDAATLNSIKSVKCGANTTGSSGGGTTIVGSGGGSASSGGLNTGSGGSSSAGTITQPAPASTCGTRPGDKPGPTNTGPCNVLLLKPYTGPTTITVNGTVIENADITGGISIKANNVTIRNSRIRGGSSYIIHIPSSGYSGLTLEDVELDGLQQAGDAIAAVVGLTARRLNIHHTRGDGLKMFSNSLIEDSWIHHLGMSDGAHADGVQLYSTGSPISNVTIRRNNFDMPLNIANTSSNAAIFTSTALLNVVADSNWMNGGNYTVYCSSNMTLTNNKFGRSYRYGVVNRECERRSGNVWEDTGLPIPGESATTPNPTQAAPVATPTSCVTRPGGKPGPHNTGPCDVSKLVARGSLTIDEAAITARGGNRVFENLDITGGLSIKANNVTVRNFRINAGFSSHYGINVNNGNTGIVLEDGEIFGALSSGMLGGGFTGRRLNIHDTNGDGMKVQTLANTPVLVEASWIHNLGIGDGAHADGNQTRGSSGAIIFRGNNCDMPVNAPSPYKSNACFILQLDITVPFIIEDNWLNGGNYTIYCSPSTVVRNNRFGREYRYGIRNGCDNWTNNVWEDNGLLTTSSSETKPPDINSAVSVNVTGTSATFTWTTYESSDSQVDYGTVSKPYYDYTYQQSTNVPTRVTNHSVIIQNLQENTKYYYVARSRDANGNRSSESEASFTTGDANGNPAPAPTTPPPSDPTNEPSSTAQSVTSFTLVNAVTDQDIMTMTDGMTISFASIGTNQINIRANTNPSVVGGVKFGLDGNANHRQEDGAPYASHGNTGTNYAAWTPSLGNHTITATPYSGAGATGTAGTPQSITFTVTN